MRSVESTVINKGTVVDVHVMKTYGDIGIELHSFLTSDVYVDIGIELHSFLTSDVYVE